MLADYNGFSRHHKEIDAGTCVAFVYIGIGNAKAEGYITRIYLLLFVLFYIYIMYGDLHKVYFPVCLIPWRVSHLFFTQFI